jgi:hypothetical protein
MRRQVLGGLAGREGTAGLGILMTQGMGAWMLRCRELTPVAAGAGRHDALAAPIPVELETQMAAMIAGMVLNRNRKELP